jgi:hypothetical protein
MHVGTARNPHPEAPEIVPSAHCVKRYRERMPIRAPGLDAVASSLLDALASADVSRWAPSWAMSDRSAPMWAVAGDLAFPLTPTGHPGRWLAVTCLRRGRDRG